MSCSNCYNNCPEITSDRCVKYTGIDVPVLGIKNGDSLSYIEQALIEFLTAALDGTGIKIDIDPTVTICTLVKNNLPTCGDLTAKDLFETLIKSVCDLQSQVLVLNTSVSTITNTILTIEGPYDTNCLTGITSTSGTHDTLQAVINKLCAFILEVSSTYVKVADINTYIANYLSSQGQSGTGQKYYNLMIPYAIVAYYGDLTNFAADGTGIGSFEKIYLCNGQNGTPDLRGRTIVGALDMGSTALDNEVNPAVSLLNPPYVQGYKWGVNGIQLTTAELPSHKHDNILNFADPGHTHNYTLQVAGSENNKGTSTGVKYTSTVTPTASNTTGITCTITNAYKGDGVAHANTQPSLGLYYIMYKP